MKFHKKVCWLQSLTGDTYTQHDDPKSLLRPLSNVSKQRNVLVHTVILQNNSK